MIHDWIWGVAFLVGLGAVWAYVDLRFRRQD
ncbi:hypothetical protein SAMN04489725_10682 [Alicyclobacillus hesperidum]|uniref:Uncharacterized protein n=1 Tax=Alicyclobacillus hesperidum TaxID=89784 RepID=A0A1H2TQX5_9BACL|nr:hypothetical protein SAMN04489725_10682 [Alicyclobacillus hesperidum]